LEGTNPTPNERLLAERVSLCWLIVQWYEDACVYRNDWGMAQGDYQHRIIDKAHRRFLTAVQTVAQIRKPALATLQVNIARNQVNVAEPRPMSEGENGLSPDQLRAVNVLSGAESDGVDVAGSDPETAAEWLRGDPEFIASLNRTKSFRRERLRADVRSLASVAIATLRELVGPGVAASVRLRRASLAILQAADALNVEEIGPTSAEGVRAKGP
jgi:hypothetical protein